jgi:hypothetical protein
MEYYQQARLAQDKRIRDRYVGTAALVTSDWERTGQPCDCGGDHRKIRYWDCARNTHTTCPVLYYLHLAYKAVVESSTPPSQDLYWKLLGQSAPRREEVPVKTGLLWFDNKGEIEERISRAIDRHRKKFGVWPNTCCVNKAQVGDLTEIDGVNIVVRPNALVDHFWVGVTTA